MNPKTEPAFPVLHSIDGNWAKEPIPSLCGLSQYAEIAARFHAALIPQHHTGAGPHVASIAFDQADAFFAELAERTK